MDTRQIIDYAIDDNAKEMREALYNSIYDRVAAAFESKKQEYAQSLFGGMPLATEEVDISDYSIEELEEFMQTEEFEQLDELSKTTLGNYVKKASSFSDKRSNSNLASKAAHKLATNGYGSGDDGEKEDSKSVMRSKGISRAVDRLTKEESEKEDDDCEKAAKKEVKKHEKSMHKNEGY